MKRVAVGILSLAAMIFFFQNCGKAGFENQDFSSELSTSSSLDTKLSKLPFPYDISVNQIAHMSCTLSNANGNSPYFSWKVGAFDNPTDVPSSNMNIRPAGLRLSDKFITEWNKVSATYNPQIQSDKLKEALMGLPSVANTNLQLSFRKTNTPRVDLMSLPSGSPAPTSTFLTTVSSDEISAVFQKKPGEVYNFFPSVPNFSSRFLEGSLNVPSAYGAMDVALRAQYDSSFLALGFLKAASTGGTSTELASPASDDRYAYGKGYRIHFGVNNPHTGTNEYPSSDSLAVVEEYDLETGYPVQGVGWDCSYKFKIVRPQDRYMPSYRANHFAKIGGACPTVAVTGDYCASPIDQTFGIHPSYFPNGICPSNRTLVKNAAHCEEQYSQTCPQEPYSGNLNHPNPIQRDDGLHHDNHPERPAILHALRRFLPANQWDINVSRRCVVPKYDDNSCYPTGKAVYDEYFFPGAQANLSLGQYAGCGVNGQYPCAAYLTLCVRR